MENIEGARSRLDEARRAATLPWTEYPPTPRWYFPAAGAWCAALVLAFGVIDRTPLFFTAILLLLVAELAFLRWYQRYRGVMPSLRHPPAELEPVIARYAVGVALVTAGVVGTAWRWGTPAGAAVAFPLVTAGLVVYERAYERAVRTVRERVR